MVPEPQPPAVENRLSGIQEGRLLRRTLQHDLPAIQHDIRERRNYSDPVIGHSARAEIARNRFGSPHVHRSDPSRITRFHDPYLI